MWLLLISRLMTSSTLWDRVSCFWGLLKKSLLKCHDHSRFSLIVLAWFWLNPETRCSILNSVYALVFRNQDKFFWFIILLSFTFLIIMASYRSVYFGSFGMWSKSSSFSFIINDYLNVCGISMICLLVCLWNPENSSSNSS